MTFGSLWAIFLSSHQLVIMIRVLSVVKCYSLVCESSATFVFGRLKWEVCRLHFGLQVEVQERVTFIVSWQWSTSESCGFPRKRDEVAVHARQIGFAV